MFLVKSFNREDLRYQNISANAPIIANIVNNSLNLEVNTFIICCINCSGAGADFFVVLCEGGGRFWCVCVCVCMDGWVVTAL